MKPDPLVRSQPPAWYWRERYCKRGRCAYGWHKCPNGCPDRNYCEVQQ